MDVTTMSEGADFTNIFFQIGAVGYAILFVLLVFSIISWGIIFYKYHKLSQNRKEAKKFMELYHENSDLSEVYAACVPFRTASVVRVFKSGYLELQRIRKDMMTVNVERKSNMDVIIADWVEGFTSVLQETIVREVLALEHLLIFLAVTSSAGPLLGLLGTVWGIIVAFWSVGIQGTSNLKAIAPGISAALTTTVGGLVTAIPATIAYNLLLNRVKALSAELECFASEFTGVVRKEFRKVL